MPYAKIQQMSILFNNLPLDVKGEIGVIPRKPSLYGSSQRRKLWLTRHDWSFGISLPGPSSDSCITPTAITHTSTSHTPAPSFCNSSTFSSPPGLSQKPFYITNHLFIAIHLNITIHTSYQHAIHYTSFSPDTCHCLSAPLVRCLSSPSTNVKPSHILNLKCCYQVRPEKYLQFLFFYYEHTRGNVMIEVQRVLTPALHPLCHEAIDEGESVFSVAFMNGLVSNLFSVTRHRSTS